MSRERYLVEKLCMLVAPGSDGGRAAQYVLMGIANRYRAAAEKLTKHGTNADGAMLSAFVDEVTAIEEDAKSWQP